MAYRVYLVDTVDVAIFRRFGPFKSLRSATDMARSALEAYCNPSDRIIKLTRDESYAGAYGVLTDDHELIDFEAIIRHV